MINYKSIAIGLFSTLLFNTGSTAQTSTGEVKVSGAMKNVMRKGELSGTIHLDTIQNKKHLYGLGPVEYLKGEILILDGRSYVSAVKRDGSIQGAETYDVKAPFLVYSNTENWKAYKLPERIKTAKQLEAYIDEIRKNYQRPFSFKLEGTFAQVNFHIQNLPDGAVVKEPNDAHKGQEKYERTNVSGTIVGFFSTEHQSIFTHHDSYIHMHFINSDRTEMGHIDDLILDGKSKVKIYMPGK